MGRKRKQDIEPSRLPDCKRLKTSTPLEKVDDFIDPTEIIKDDKKLIQVHFVSGLMVRNYTNQEIRDAYEKEFGESISLNMVTRLKQLVRVIYTSEISRNRDEMVAEELMHANWELRELQEYWDKSKQGKKVTTSHVANCKGSEMIAYDLDETTTVTEKSFGDLNAMKRIADVRTRIINLLGLNAPKSGEEEGSGKKNNAITINIVGQRKVAVEEAEVVQ